MIVSTILSKLGRRSTGLALVLLLAGTLIVSADDPAPDKPTEPPVRLKKKSRPETPDAAKPPTVEEKEKPASKPSPPRLEEPKDGPEPADNGEKEAEILARIARNLKAAEDRLAKSEINDGTKQLQEDILKDLDALIEQSMRSQNSGSSGGEQQQQDQQKQQGQQGQMQQGQQRQQGGQGQQARGGTRRQQRQQARGGRKPGQGNQPEQGNQPPDQLAQNNGKNGGGGGKSEEGANKIADVYKDVWGHLPESLRGEMNAYYRERFMVKYKDLIEQYYSTISEKARKKGD